MQVTKANSTKPAWPGHAYMQLIKANSTKPAWPGHAYMQVTVCKQTHNTSRNKSFALRSLGASVDPFNLSCRRPSQGLSLRVKSLLPALRIAKRVLW
eukprot:6544026-Alexandrium_andersonii.AAC.1